MNATLETTPHEMQTAAVAPRGGKYLTFTLGREEYGLEILRVREIIGYMEITAVPRARPYVKGVINLRGKVIPVYDLRARLGMEPAPRTDRTCIIVVDVQGEGRGRTAGIIVDAVCEVVLIPADHIDPTPQFDPSVDVELVQGLGKIGHSIKILLDIDKVLGSTGGMSTAGFSHSTGALSTGDNAAQLEQGVTQRAI